MLHDEGKEHIAGTSAVGGIHRHLSEEVFYLGMEHCKSAKTIPKIVEGKKSLCSLARRLILQRHKRASELKSVREIILKKFVGEMEKMPRSDMRCTIGCELHVGTEYESVSTDDLLGGRIPYYELTARIGHDVEFVDITLQTGATPRIAKGYLTQTPYLPHGVRGTVGIHDVNFIVAFIATTQHTRRSEFGTEQLAGHGGDYLLFHSLLRSII